MLGSWAYPDGFAAVIAARLLGVPCVVKLHGSDINLIARLAGPRRLTRVGAAARGARRRGQPGARRRGRRARRGARADRDRDERRRRELFHPRDRAAARAELGLPAQARSRSTSGTSRTRERRASISPAAWTRTVAGRSRRDARRGRRRSAPGELEAGVAPLGDRVRMVGAQPLAVDPDVDGRRATCWCCRATTRAPRTSCSRRCPAGGAWWRPRSAASLT